MNSIEPCAVVKELEKRGLKIIRVAPLYRSAPAEGVTGGDFLNTVFECEKGGSADNFLLQLQAVELFFGSRVRKQMQERTCDLDLLLWGCEQIEFPDLTVPHPRLHQRDFVLAPLCDLIPDEALPLLRKTPRELLSELQARYIIRQISE